MDIQNLIAQVKAYQPKKIILFGSQLYGKPWPDSDVDIVLVKNTHKPFHDRLIDVRRLLRTTVPVDIFVFTEKEIAQAKDTNPFIHEILTKGKVVYGQ